MSRRGQGLTLLVAVLIVFVAGLAVAAPRVPGLAVAIPPPGPPAVGMCAGSVSGEHELLRSGRIGYDEFVPQPCQGAAPPRSLGS